MKIKPNYMGPNLKTYIYIYIYIHTYILYDNPDI